MTEDGLACEAVLLAFDLARKNQKESLKCSRFVCFSRASR